MPTPVLPSGSAKNEDATNMKKTFLLTIAIVLAAASATKMQAQPYAIAGDFNGWNNNDTASLVGGPGIYTNIATGGTAGNYEGLKIIAVPGSWTTTYPGNNCVLKYDANGGHTVYFYPTPALDGWSPTQNRVGYEDPGNMAFEIAGDFTTPNWDSDPNAQLVSAGNGVYTNTYIVATAGAHQFKFRSSGTWSGAQIGADFGGGNNASFTTTSANQPVLFTLDLRNGRWFAVQPQTVCFVRFQVDMTLVAATDPNFIPSSVTVNGDAFGWGGTACTNNPNSPTPNVYSAVIPLLAGTAVQYQFRYSNGQTVYDALNGQSGVNRTLTVPDLSSTNVPAVFFNDAAPDDLLNVDTAVTFSVNMANAVLYGTATPFDPQNDSLFTVGDFNNWTFGSPLDIADYRLTDPDNDLIYTCTVTFPKGHNRALTYKYAVNDADNEAGFAQNHFRYIRSTTGTEVLPMDTFGVQYSEPKFGNLAIGAPVNARFPITWLGYPGVLLQDTTNLTSTVWSNNPDTTGQNSTNWPVSSGNHFFRLVKP